MAKCGIRDCTGKVIGGFEHYTYATASDVTPKIIDRDIICWCAAHKSDLEDKVELPGDWLTQKDVDKL